MNPTAIAIPLAALIAHSAIADLTLSGYVWGGGFPGPSQESFSAIGSQGGTGGGTTAGGFGRAGISVSVELEGEASSIRLTGSAQHPDDSNGHSSAYTRNPETFAPEGLLLTLGSETDFAITNSSFATPFPPQFASAGFFEITPARLSAISGTITSADGLSGRLSAGTYRLEIFISAFGDPSYLPEWAGYQPLLDLGQGVQSASMNWTLAMTVVPAPGVAVLGIAAFLTGRSRRR